MYYDAQRNLLYFTGMTYGRYFDGSGGADTSEGDDGYGPHLSNGDCFLGVLKLPDAESSSSGNDGNSLKGHDPSWLIHTGGDGGERGAKLIYARRYVCTVCCFVVLVCFVWERREREREFGSA